MIETKISNIITEESLNSETPKVLLSTGISNTKTAKNSLKTFILYLAPYNQNSKGINICPKASEGCAAACLFSAGRGIMTPVIRGRVKKTEYYLRDKKAFINQLSNEIIIKYNTAKKRNEKIAFRLNGTSDVDFVYLLKKYSDLDITSLKDHCIFYDYTKIKGKVVKYLNHPNYILTFSRAEDNNQTAKSILAIGGNIAVVFKNELPKYWSGFKVIDGDKSDLEMVYNRNVILGLRAKGQAKKDKSGFAV
tara:strand:- start:12688 stop:13437 length:750 start_codon:yes stop_codon:yes gene_type:complete